MKFVWFVIVYIGSSWNAYSQLALPRLYQFCW